MRLQEYGVGIFEATATKSALKKLLKKKCISVDGITASTATMIRGGETIHLNLPTIQKPTKFLELPLEVRYEDEFLAAINKPAGIAVSGNKFRTIANALPFNLKDSSESDSCIPQPVHRLDFPTTGILLVGKTASCIRALNRMFEDKQVDKTYYAITMGIMEPIDEIRVPLDEKIAHTTFQILASVPSEKYGQLNLLRLHPKTGRRNQLRRHLAGIGHPILGDRKYGSEFKGTRLYLHAASLEFRHPIQERLIYIEASLPPYFNKIFPSINN
ncbi:RluA family pseudouridine synthase [Zeaxanthinibacter sp. PT1]|uniref:RluA family pseudouridine synthase n=1 Tax=Zeaxanthinibacter TaxID=561554 RepID=UPI00234BFB22|nr:RluA family pseudouridine synthase [Zeaxanthinibacter sp. PT1]MDC6350958.1 RluA family pseudouridine synthase [Zeaxanthinibacter sp. PT1]